jgi:hypothetical protein
MNRGFIDPWARMAIEHLGVITSRPVLTAVVVLAPEKYNSNCSMAVLEWPVKWTNRRIAMSKAQKGNKEKKKPKADKNQPKTHVSAYKAAQGQGKSSFNPFARKTWG